MQERVIAHAKLFARASALSIITARTVVPLVEEPLDQLTGQTALVHLGNQLPPWRLRAAPRRVGCFRARERVLQWLRLAGVLQLNCESE